MQAQAKKTRPIRYAVGMFGTSIPINMLKTYAAVFYVNQLGLTTAQYSLAILIYTFIDAVDNPIYGYFSDRTRSRWGRRRPWLVIGAPILALGLLAFFNPPSSLENSSLFLYFLLTYILTGTIDSLINANYGALFPDLFRGEDERAVTNAMRQAFQLVAMIISIALTPVITSAIGFPRTALVYGLLGGVVILFSALGSHESDEYLRTEKPVFWPSLLALAKNTKFWIAGLANAFYSATMALVMSAVPFYIEYTLGLPGSAATPLFATVLLVAIFGVALWARVIRRYTVIPVWRIAFLLLAISFIPLYFANSLATAIASGVVLGIGFAGVISTMDLIQARIIDEDAAAYQTRREGIFTSAAGFMNRLNGLFTSLAFFLVNRLYGFESGDIPGNQPGEAARFLLTIFPFGLIVIAFVISWFLRFSKEGVKENEQIVDHNG